MIRIVTVLLLSTVFFAACASTQEEAPPPPPAPAASAPPPAPEPEPEPVPAAPAETFVAEPVQTLPDTASHAPALGLTGLAALAGAGVLGVVRRRM